MKRMIALTLMLVLAITGLLGVVGRAVMAKEKKDKDVKEEPNRERERPMRTKFALVFSQFASA